MDPLTHLAAGAVCSQLLRSPSRVWAMLAGIGFALLPDVDYFLVFWDRLAFMRHHRGITHSLLAIPVLALLGALLARTLGGPRWFRPMFYLGLMVLSSHVLLDLATSYGTQILNPVSTRRFALDLFFIIDPYLTVLLLAGAGCALYATAWGRTAALATLAVAGIYLAVCGLFHHQAMNLARGLMGPEKHAEVKLAALPQPFSCRRWQLLATDGGQIRQAFVELPYGAFLGLGDMRGQAQGATAVPDPDVTYQPPERLAVKIWTPAATGENAYSPAANAILARFLEFARFPILHRVRRVAGGQEQEWLDVRFTMPQRAVPFVLHLDLDDGGGLKSWAIGGVSRTVKSYGGRILELKDRVASVVRHLLGKPETAGHYAAYVPEGEKIP